MKSVVNLRYYLAVEIAYDMNGEPDFRVLEKFYEYSDKKAKKHVKQKYGEEWRWQVALYKLDKEL